MPTFRYDKLVRDNIAQFHLDAGHTPVVTRLKGKELVAALCKKLHEEADEVDGALSEAALAEEIADVQQIIDDLCAVANISKTEVEKAREKKEKKKGGFQKGVYVETVYIPNEADEMVTYCRRDPEKYLEITSEP